MKKLFSLFLCLTTCFLIFTLCTPVAFAATYSGACNSETEWSLDTTSGTLTISGSGPMNECSLSSTPGWDRYQGYIKSVVFENGVTSIGGYTFYNGGNGYKYKKLTTIDFGTVKTISKYAFRGCAAIKNISNAGSVTTIGDYAFAGCTALEAFPFPAAINIGNGAFSCCSEISAINFPSSIRKIGGAAFEKCTSVSNITLPTGLTSIGDRAFADCTGITSVNYNPSSLTTIGSGIFNGSGVDSGVTLNISNSISTIPANIFSYFSNLKTVQGGTAVSAIKENAFAHTGITSFHVGSSVSEISTTAFSDTTSLGAFTVDSENEYFSANSAGILFNQTGNQIIRYPGGKQDISYTVPSKVNSIREGAFRESKYLKTFTAGTTIVAISNNCFINCPSLTTVNLASTVKTIGAYTFANCKLLTTVGMSGVDTINNYAFAECDALPSLTTSSNLRRIGDYAFYDCDGIYTLNITSGLTTLGKYSFYSCKNLREITIPSTVSTISEGAFSFCSSLDTINLSNNLKTIEKYAFLSCNATQIRIPSTVTTIGDKAVGFDFISSSSYKAKSGFTIYGASGSTAKTYASTYGLSFVANSADEFEIDLTTPEQAPENTFSFLDFFMNFNFDVFFRMISRAISFILDLMKG